MANNKVQLSDGTVLIDLTSDTATASDVASGKTFHLADGTQATGTASGGGGSTVPVNRWIRPSGWPDYDSITIGSEELYFTVDANDNPSPFMYFKVVGTGTLTLENGSLINNAFVAEGSQTVTSNTDTLVKCTPNAGYIVYRLTSVGGHITKLNFSDKWNLDVDGMGTSSRYQDIIEIYGALPHMTYFCARFVYNLVSCTLLNMGSLNDLTRAFNEEPKLENVKITGLSALSSCYYLCSSAPRLMYLDLDGYDMSTVTSIMNMFYGTQSLRYVNCGLDFPNADGAGSAFYDFAPDNFNAAPKLKKISGAIQSLFRNSGLTEAVLPDWGNTSGWTNMSYMFHQSSYIKKIDFSNLDLSGITASGNAFQSCYGLEYATLPSTLGIIGNSMFQNCNSLRELHIQATTPPTLQNTNALSGVQGVIYVPYSSDHSILEAYQTATNWSSYASSIVEESA